MDQIELINDLFLKGLPEAKISTLLKVDIKTVKKYTQEDDFSPKKVPVAKKRSSKLDAWKGIIKQWHEDDRRMRYKQRHTAKRIHSRLLKEYPDSYDCSYATIQRYCKNLKSEEKKNQGNQDLLWHPGEAQVDFGEADFIYKGEKVVRKYLCLSFPHSNGGFTQVFGGETSECVTEGLKAIFKHIGGVPQRIVFDNATGVGRRVKTVITMSDLFKRFKCHYGFEVSFCNPYSGHEKGNVENKVGYVRRNFFVPIPEYDDIVEYNKRLLCLLDDDMKRLHYREKVEISKLFREDQKNLSSLPLKDFNACRYDKIKSDGYGKICLDGKHTYSSSPENARKELVVEIGAHMIRIFDQNGEVICTHERIYGSVRSESIDYSTTISTLMKKPGAWRNSRLRQSLPDGLKDKMDSVDTVMLKDHLKTMNKISSEYSFDVAIKVMCEAAKIDRLDEYSVTALATRMLTQGISSLAEKGPRLENYDEAFIEAVRS